MIINLSIDIEMGKSETDALRIWRDRLLAASDWTQLPDNGLSNEQRAAWATYRQALRDAPATWTPSSEWDAPEPPN